MRRIRVEEIVSNIKEMCIEANHYLTEDMKLALKEAEGTERSPLGKQILHQLEENLQIASQDMIPICQDTGMAVIFMEIGQGASSKTASKNRSIPSRSVSIPLPFPFATTVPEGHPRFQLTSG